MRINFVISSILLLGGCTYDAIHEFASENCKTDFIGFPDIPDWQVSSIPSQPDTNLVNEVYFFEDKKGLLFTEKNIWLTKNEGNSWEKVFSSDLVYAYDISFIDGLQGFVAGRLENKYCLLKTNDGGESWATIYLDSIDFFEHISFASANIGIASFNHWNINHTLSYRYNAKTTDGGLTWKVIPDLSANSREKVTMKLLPNGFGYIPGRNGDMHLTNDFGETWKTLNPGIDDLYAGQFLDMDTGFVSSFNQVYKTVDGGKSWTTISENRAEMIHFFSSQDGVLLIHIATDYNIDSNILINCFAFLTTYNGGISWVEGPPSVNFEMKEINFISSGLGYAFSWKKPYSASKLFR
ncbi:MAG TPA: hypothetical protein VFG10_15585 [Saprospiraceae bacterium]|nr:hypothetical protein [Saprospiraceae bacterium]